MEKIGKYAMQESLTNRSAGYSMWGFGTCGGKAYFIKQFLSPKYPVKDTEASTARLQKRRAQCDSFVRRKVALYEVLNRCSDGNDVRVCEFFRVNTRFYIAMEKVEAVPLSIEDMQKLPLEERERLCKIIAHAVSGLHRGRLVHADLKHENILFTYTRAGTLTAKVIDFDSGFLESDPPEAGEEIVGDFNYFAPEAYSSMSGEAVALTCKMDVFAMGVLFHQYLTGALPAFDSAQYTCPGDAARNGCELGIAPGLPVDIANLLEDMLDPLPENRPTAENVFLRLNGEDQPCVVVPVRSAEIPVTPAESPFYLPGDLS